MLTPTQAAQKWCPMVRASNGLDQTANCGNSPEYRVPKFACCVADQCAMWRWSNYLNQFDGIDRSKQERHGFCGLAITPSFD